MDGLRKRKSVQRRLTFLRLSLNSSVYRLLSSRVRKTNCTYKLGDSGNPILSFIFSEFTMFQAIETVDARHFEPCLQRGLWQKGVSLFTL